MYLNTVFIMVLRRGGKKLFSHLQKMLRNQLIILKTGEKTEIKLFILALLYKFASQDSQILMRRSLSLFEYFRYK